METYATTVRMLHSGRVIKDTVRNDGPDRANERHEQLVSDLAAIVRGRSDKECGSGGLRTTILVRGKPLIEVTTA